MDRNVYEYISHITNDPIAFWQTCTVTGEPFAITEKDLAFYDAVSPTLGGRKFLIPPPTLSPEIRHQRRLAFANCSNFYRRKCHYSGKTLVAQIPEESPMTVYEREIWESDVWNGFDYGREYRRDTPFTKQFESLLYAVPIPHNPTLSSTNCEYSMCTFSKDCYLLCIGGECEKVFYSEWLIGSKDSYNCTDSNHLENCSDCIEVSSASNCHFLQKSENCSDCFYSVALVGCSHCFLCHNLTNQSYCIQNIPYSMEDWKREVAKLLPNGSFDTAKKREDDFRTMLTNVILPGTKTLWSEDCYGNIIEGSKNLVFATHGTDSKDCKFGFLANFHNENCYDTSSYYSQLCLESVSGWPTYHCLFCFELQENNRDLLYSAYCQNCEHCFGCVGLKNAKYCILNRQYSKEEYEQLVAQIIGYMKETGEWGKFFDPQISPFSYEWSEAFLYRPMNSQDTFAGNFRFYFIKPPEYAFTKTLSSNLLPDSLHDTPDDVLNWAIECEVTGKFFRILPEELAFYKKHNLPLPRLHPDVRRSLRAKARSGSDFFIREDTSGAFFSVYPPEYPCKIVSNDEYTKKSI